MKLLITGALGHIGSQVIRDFAHVFPSVHIVMVDNLNTQRYCSLFDLPISAQYSFIEGNVKSINWDDILKEIDVVIHLAALTDAAGTADRPDEVYQNNFDSTQVLAQACLKAGVPIIFPSSTSVYGSQSDLVDENCTELQPQSPYAECKIKEEQLIQLLALKGLKSVVCRLGTIYGTSPGMRFHTAVNKFCWQAVMGQPVSVWKTALHQKRPYLCLKDCVNAFSWIIKQGLFQGEIYNIVSNNFTVHDVIEEIKKHVPTLKVELVEHKIMNQLSYEVSAQKFSSTGFVFQGSLSEGIQETINLIRQPNQGAA